MKKFITLTILTFLFMGCAATYDKTETMMIGTGVDVISGMLLLSGPGSIIAGAAAGGLAGYSYYEIKEKGR